MRSSTSGRPIRPRPATAARGPIWINVVRIVVPSGVARPMTDQLLELLTTYGLPALFVAMILAAAGMPFPSSLTLVAMGSFVAQGELSFWPVVAAGSAGAVIGDQIGYAFGRYGGRPCSRP